MASQTAFVEYSNPLTGGQTYQKVVLKGNIAYIASAKFKRSDLTGGLFVYLVVFIGLSLMQFIIMLPVQTARGARGQGKDKHNNTCGG